MNIELAPTEYRIKLNYDDALLYCAMLEIDGKNDWRMPTIEECRQMDGLLTTDSEYVQDGYPQFWIFKPKLTLTVVLISNFINTEDWEYVYDIDTKSKQYAYGYKVNYICPVRNIL